MAACQLLPPCAHLGLLLLLIGVISSNLPKVWGRPTDFWCNSHTRKSMMVKLEELKKEMAGCVGSDMLPSDVQLPCVWIQPADWKNKTLQQKRAEVLGALRVFQAGVQRASAQAQQTTLQCRTLLLKKLEHHIRNYVTIFNRLQTQNDTSHSSIQHCFSQTSLSKLLEEYVKLLNRKVERLVSDHHDSICNAKQRTTKGL